LECGGFKLEVPRFDCIGGLFDRILSSRLGRGGPTLSSDKGKPKFALATDEATKKNLGSRFGDP